MMLSFVVGGMIEGLHSILQNENKPTEKAIRALTKMSVELPNIIFREML